MKPLSHDALDELRAIRRAIRFGWDLSQSDLDRLTDSWRERFLPEPHDESELFDIARADGTSTGVIGPRWVFHLLGLAHRASHVGLCTEGGLIVLQRRSLTKREWPGAWDMAVAGHVSVAPGGEPMSYEEGAWKETEEEIGLAISTRDRCLREGGLLPVGAPYFSYDENVSRNPPFHNAEVRALFAATLTAEGLAALRPCPEELSGILLCTQEEAWALLEQGPVASGLRCSGPLYLGWLMHRSSARS